MWRDSNRALTPQADCSCSKNKIDRHGIASGSSQACSGCGARLTATRSPVHAEAGIAAEHCSALSYQQTRWGEIADLYALLERAAPSPLHTLNKAVAIAEWQGAQAGLAVLDGVAPPAWLTGSYLWDAVLGDLHRRAGHTSVAREYRERALNSAPTDAVRELLSRRLAMLE
jgi:predicted RNA polymerase sigma factor